jgi:hypothetical protein
VSLLRFRLIHCFNRCLELVTGWWGYGARVLLWLLACILELVWLLLGLASAAYHGITDGMQQWLGTSKHRRPKQHMAAYALSPISCGCAGVISCMLSAATASYMMRALVMVCPAAIALLWLQCMCML